MPSKGPIKGPFLGIMTLKLTWALVFPERRPAVASSHACTVVARLLSFKKRLSAAGHERW